MIKNVPCPHCHKLIKCEFEILTQGESLTFYRNKADQMAAKVEEMTAYYKEGETISKARIKTRDYQIEALKRQLLIALDEKEKLYIQLHGVPEKNIEHINIKGETMSYLEPDEEPWVSIKNRLQRVADASAGEGI